MAAILACAPSVASHSTAGWLWGLLRYPPSTFHLTAPSRRRAKRGFVVHFAALTERDLGDIDGIPVTALPRTLLDLAPMLSPQRLATAIERTEELELFDLPAFDDLLSRAGSHPGVRRLRDALVAYRPELAFTRSGLERRFLDLVRDAGLPEPSMNRFVEGYEVDAYWEAERFAVELDVYETHGTRAAFERDRRREDDLLLAGIETLRITGPRLDREPDATLARVASHLERRRHPVRRL